MIKAALAAAPQLARAGQQVFMALIFFS